MCKKTFPELNNHVRIIFLCSPNCLDPELTVKYRYQEAGPFIRVNISVSLADSLINIVEGWSLALRSPFYPGKWSGLGQVQTAEGGAPGRGPGACAYSSEEGLTVPAGHGSSLCAGTGGRRGWPGPAIAQVRAACGVPASRGREGGDAARVGRARLHRALGCTWGLHSWLCSPRLSRCLCPSHPLPRSCPLDSEGSPELPLWVSGRGLCSAVPGFLLPDALLDAPGGLTHLP